MIRWFYRLVLFIIMTSFAFAQAPRYSRLLYENPLTGEGQDAFAIIANKAGVFVDNGWRAERNSKLTLQLQNRLPAVWSIEFSITNFNPRVQATHGKQTIFCFTSRPHSQLSLFYEDSLSSFTFLRTGTNYFNGDDKCGMEFDTAFEGKVSRDKDREVLMDNKWSYDKTYRFKFVWDHDYIWLYFNGQEVKKQLMKGPIERIQHISIGGDDIYNSVAGPIYSDLKIYTAETPVRFDDKSFTNNVVGLEALKGGHGLAVADVNNDGLDDIYVANYREGESLRDILYIQQADHTFADETAVRGIDENAGSFSALFFDADNDGDVDLFCSDFGGGNRLYINDGDGFFSQESAVRGMEASDARTSAAVAFDADNDGDVDLLAVNQNSDHEMYINDGSGHFSLQARGFAAGSAAGDDTPSVTAVDFDNDGDADIYLSWPNAANELFVNDGDGFFTDRAAQFGVDAGERTQGAVFADFDRDGDPDLFLASKVKSYTPDSLFLDIYTNDGAGHFTAYSPPSRLAMSGFSVQLFDADNDGLLDVYCLQNNQFDRYYESRIWNFFRTSMARLYLGDGGGFVYAGDGAADIVGADARSVLANDFDGDGDVDIYLTTAEYENVFLENSSDLVNNWIDVTVIGAEGDAGGIGSKIWLYEPGHLGDAAHLLAYREVVSQSGYLSANNLRQHFGLGDWTTCDVRIERVNGAVQTRQGLAANQRHVLTPDVWHIEYVSGDEQSVYVNELLPEPLVVAVRNQVGQPVAGATVLFRMVQGDGRIQGDSLVYTDDAGMAQAFVVAGSTPGTLWVHAMLPDAPDSTIEFTAVVETPVYLLNKQSGDGQSGVVGEPLPNDVVVQVVDARGAVVSDYQVLFTVADGGTIDGDSLRTVISDADGLASVSWTLGTVVGDYTLMAATSDDTLFFTATARAAHAAAMHKISGDGQAFHAGQAFASPFVVFVGDAYGNAVENFPVQFTVVSGGGHISGENSREAVTDSAGLARVFWTPGVYLGPDNILQAAAQFDSSPLQNSPLQWVYPGIPVDARTSTITATSPQPADGASRAEIVVVLKDSLGQPVGAGLQVRFSATGANNFWSVPDTLTDADGVIKAYLSSTTPETKIVSATVMGLNLTLADTAEVEFTPLPQIPAQLKRLSGDGQSGIVGKPLAEPLVVQLVDAEGEGVPDYPIRFQVQKSGGHADSLELSPVLTDANGRASLTYTLGTRAGVSIVAAIVDSVQGSPVIFQMQARPDVPASLTIISGDNQSADPGESLPEPLVVLATDRYHNVVPGQPVVFTARNGGAVLSTQPLLTDSLGVVRCRVAVGDSAGLYYFIAAHDTVNAVFSAVARSLYSNNPPVIESWLPTDTVLAAEQGQLLSFELTASDPDGDPVSYRWLLDDWPVSDSSAFSFVPNASLPSTVYITGFVYDHSDTTKRTWIVNVKPTSVELINFNASARPGVGIVVSWQTPAGVSVAGYDVLRSATESGSFEKIGAVSASSAQNSYTFIDKDVPADVLRFYKIQMNDRDGRSTLFGPVSAKMAAPDEMALHSNYPNPFNPSTSIRFELPRQMRVSLVVFNAKGQRVKTLLNGGMDAGWHTVTWNADDDAGAIVPSGIYYCRLSADGRTMVRKMLLLK